MFDQQVFRERVKALRLERGEKQEDLAGAVGIRKSQVSRIESGQRAVSVETLAALAEHFEVSIDYLVGMSNDPKHK